VNRTTDVIRQMVDEDLKLVWYHGIGKKKPHLIELQTTTARALNTPSTGFVGPQAVSNDVLTELLQLKFVEKAASSDATKSIFHLTDTGRARALELHR
jgi:hypothetical protein